MSICNVSNYTVSKFTVSIGHMFDQTQCQSENILVSDQQCAQSERSQYTYTHVKSVLITYTFTTYWDRHFRFIFTITMFHLLLSLSFPILSSSFFLFSILILSSALSLLAFGLLATNDIFYFLLISLHPYSLRPLHSFLLLLCLFLSRFSYLYFLFNTLSCTCLLAFFHFYLLSHFISFISFTLFTYSLLSFSLSHLHSSIFILSSLFTLSYNHYKTHYRCRKQKLY